MMKRKARIDRNHIVYQITCVTTGEFYIGITVGSLLRQLKVRVQKHVRRALTESRDWNLCKAIREYQPENFEYQILEIIRGKPQAHARERELINELFPALNTQ